MMSQRLLHTTVCPGETLFDAVVRAGADTNRNGLDGYSIDCEICGGPVEDHLNGKISPQDCRPGLGLIGHKPETIIAALQKEALRRKL